jgi:hypothetical protein
MGLMSRALCAVALSGVLVIAWLAPAEGSDARGPSRCGIEGARTLVSAGQARVVVKRDRVYACLRRRGHRPRRFLLGRHRGGDFNVAGFRLAGRAVPYTREDPYGLRVIVRELRRGRRVCDTKLTLASRIAVSVALTDVKLKRNGSIAWIARSIPIDVPLNPYATAADHLPDYEVRKCDRSADALLASGHYVVPGSLTLEGTSLSWTNANQTQSSTFD